MSPSEHDLRNALHDGEGERPDIERLLAAGTAARAHRRSRLVQVAAAVVLVVAAGGVTTALVGGDGKGGSQPMSADGGGRAADDQQARTREGIAAGEPTPGLLAPSSASASPPTSQAQAAACPARFPQRALPGGGSAQSGSGALFDRVAVTITVCAYGSPLQSPDPASFVVAGSAASTLQRSLESARTTPAGVPCAAVRSTEKRNIAFVGVDSTGAELRTVTTTLTLPICDNRTTNGSAVRFGWVPPSGLAARLYALTPDDQQATLPSRSPSGKNTGTPVR